MHHPPIAHPSHVGWRAIAITSFVLVLLAALMQGQDANWDLRNYHFYTASALLDGRLDQDIAVAQLQTWHNPALDLPFAWLVRIGTPGWLVSLWLALPAFLALLFALRLLDLAWPLGRSLTRTVLAGLIGATGAAVLPSIGTTFNDAFVAAGILAALWWIIEADGRRPTWHVWLPAGLVAGAAAGFKLTGALYCVGLVATAVAFGPARTMPARLLWLAVGGGLGTVVTAGPWALYLWQVFGNPLFPYFNDWFASPDALPLSHNDLRFVPQGWDAWLVPFHLLVDSQRFSESKVADPRLLLGLLALFACSIAPRNPQHRLRISLLAFALTSYVAWISIYGIYRYTFALELLCSVAVAGMLTTFLHDRVGKIGLAVLWLACLGIGNRPNWGRVPFSTPMINVRMPALPADSLVVLAHDEGLGHAVAYLPATVPAISIRNNFMQPTRCTRMQSEAEQRVRTHRGSLFLLRKVPGSEAESRSDVLPYGLAPRSTCLPVPDNLDALELCPLTRDTVDQTCSATR